MWAKSLHWTWSLPELSLWRAKGRFCFLPLLRSTEQRTTACTPANIPGVLWEFQGFSLSKSVVPGRGIEVMMFSRWIKWCNTQKLPLYCDASAGDLPSESLLLFTHERRMNLRSWDVLLLPANQHPGKGSSFLVAKKDVLASFVARVSSFKISVPRENSV